MLIHGVHGVSFTLEWGEMKTKRKGWGIKTPKGKLTMIFEGTRRSAINVAVSSFGYVKLGARYWTQLRKEGWRSVKVTMEVEE